MTKFCKAIATFLLATPLFAQYDGPAILARGQAPGAMSGGQIDFRPFVNFSGGYDTGINGVGTDVKGHPTDVSSAALVLDVGLSGLHAWRRTQVGVDYHASVHHYPGSTFFDG